MRLRSSSATRPPWAAICSSVRRKLRQAGVAAELQVYEALSHAEFLSLPVGSPLGREIHGEVTRFFDTHLAS